MKSRKGFALPLVVTLLTFMILLGGLAINIARSTHKISYGNIKKNQAFYLAKAGTEIGYGYLDSPVDNRLAPGGGPTWFNLSAPTYTAKTIDDVKSDLEAATATTQNIKVFFDSSRSDTKPIFIGPNSSEPSGIQHVANITLTIKMESSDGKRLTKQNAIYRIESKATLINTPNSVNNERVVKLDVRAANKFDKKFY